MTNKMGTINEKVNEKINEVRIQKAKVGAEMWNNFRLSITKPLSYKEITNEARNAGLPYYVRVISFLYKNGKLIKSGKYMGENFNIYDKYLLPKEPIHYSVLLDIQTCASQEAIKNAKVMEMNKTDNKSIVTEMRQTTPSIGRPVPITQSAPVPITRPTTPSIGRPVPITQSNPELISLSKISDVKLVAELRLRGYEVTAKKIIEL